MLGHDSSQPSQLTSVGDSNESLSDDPALAALLREVAAIDDVAVSPEASLAAGHRVAHFAILSELGRGGMGIVYLADDTRLRRRVALKMLTASAALDPERRRRMMREARVAATVNHPNVALVYEVGDVDGYIYIAMEYVDGETLRAGMARERLGGAQQIVIAKEILAGLDAAHAMGLVHRDLKPDNIMMDKNGSIRILDFGLAKQTVDLETPVRRDELTSIVTRAGHIMGTPAYMSPEQAAGDPIDARSDIFSFGVMLYEMLVGRRPFSGTSQVALMTALLGIDPEPPLRVRSDISPALSAVVMRCLAKKPEARFPNAGAVSHALDEAQSRRSWSRLRLVLGAVSLAVVAAGSWSAVQSRHPRVQQQAIIAAPPPLAAASAHTTPGVNGETCRIGADCITGRCTQDKCVSWSGTVAGQGLDSVNAIAVMPDGGMVITGWFFGTIDFGCSPIRSIGGPEENGIFVARINHEGICVWSRRFGRLESSSRKGGAVGNSIVTTPSGHVIVAGDFGSTIDFGDVNAEGSDDIYVVELDERGRPVWSKSFRGSGGDHVELARDPAGNLLLHGHSNSTKLSIGQFTLAASSTVNNAYAAKLSPTRDVVWARMLGKPSKNSHQVEYFGATNAQGDLAIMGAFHGTLELETGTLVSAGERDAYVAVLSGADGSVKWARRFGTAEDEPYEGGLVFDNAGNLFLTGEHRGADLGGGKLPGTIYMAKFTATGEHVWSKGFGGDSPRDNARRVVLGLDGNPIVYGRFFSKSIDLGGSKLINGGGSDNYLVRFDAQTGQTLGVKQYFGTYAPTRSLDIDRGMGNVFIAGRFEGSVDFGGGMHKANDQDGFYASLGRVP